MGSRVYSSGVRQLHTGLGLSSLKRNSLNGLVLLMILGGLTVMVMLIMQDLDHIAV
jgi:hypothetical protein